MYIPLQYVEDVLFNVPNLLVVPKLDNKKLSIVVVEFTLIRPILATVQFDECLFTAYLYFSTPSHHTHPSAQYGSYIPLQECGSHMSGDNFWPLTDTLGAAHGPQYGTEIYLINLPILTVYTARAGSIWSYFIGSILCLIYNAKVIIYNAVDFFSFFTLPPQPNNDDFSKLFFSFSFITFHEDVRFPWSATRCKDNSKVRRILPVYV